MLGGLEGIDRANRYICPTLILNPSDDSKIMQEEIFGPLLPIITYKSFDEVIERIQRGEKPLTIYYAGSTTSHNLKRI